MFKEIDGVKLWAPWGYWDAPKEAIDAITGGCGPGGFGDYLVPDTVYFLSIFYACRIHDFMYHFGETEAEKRLADSVFLNNMLRIVHAKTKWNWLKKLRARRCRIYYEMVRDYGGPVYWDGKEDALETNSMIGTWPYYPNQKNKRS